MSMMHRSRLVCLGSAVVFAFTLLVPVAVTAQEEDVAVLAPVAAPAVVGTSAASVRAVAQALAAQRALQSGAIGSLQEERLRAIVAAAPVAGPSWDEASGYSAVEASRAAPDTTWDAASGYGAVEANRVLAAQSALQSDHLGSVQEEALAAIVVAAASWNDTSGYGAVEASRVSEALGPTRAERLAQFRAIELGLSRDLGAEHPAMIVNPRDV